MLLIALERLNKDAIKFSRVLDLGNLKDFLNLVPPQ
jgi:hypothetical protein